MSRRFYRKAKKTAKSYGRKFWTRKGKYGRYVYHLGRRVAFEEVRRYANRQVKRKWRK
jgi:hypothetical protein